MPVEGGGSAHAGSEIIAQAQAWAAQDPDDRTRTELLGTIEAARAHDPVAEAELADAFSGRLQFGIHLGFLVFRQFKTGRAHRAAGHAPVVGIVGRVARQVFVAGPGLHELLQPACRQQVFGSAVTAVDPDASKVHGAIGQHRHRQLFGIFQRGRAVGTAHALQELLGQQRVRQAQA